MRYPKSLLSLITIFFTITFALVLLACGPENQVSGGDATETGNAAIVGRLLDEKGHPIAAARIQALPSGFDPGLTSIASLPDSLITYSDSDGWFKYSKLSRGDYSLEAHTQNDDRLSWIPNLRVTDARLELAAETLSTPGFALLPNHVQLKSASAYLYIPGFSRKYSLKDFTVIAGRLRLGGLPQGVIASLVLVTDSNRVSVAQNISIQPKQMTVVTGYETWYSRYTIVLNTSKSGINLTDTLFNFPMALRLKPHDFDFAPLISDGRDLRIVKPDGSPIPFEVETWAPHSSETLLWVKVDTLLPGNADQHFLMFAGNPDAGIPKFSEIIFDTSYGFSSVWHMGEEAHDTTINNLYLDVTGSGNHLNDRIESSERSGLLGLGHSFRGNDYVEGIGKGSVRKLSLSMTLSGWIKMYGTGQKGAEIISMGDNYGLRVLGDGTAYTFIWPPKQPMGSTDPWISVEASAPSLKDAGWHYVVGRLQLGIMSVFVDGNLLAQENVPEPIGYTQGESIFMSRHGNKKTDWHLDGNLDEVRIEWAARSNDWLQACYANQKLESVFPKIEKH